MAAAILKRLQEKNYQPDWIAEADAVDWLKVHRSTLFRLRQDGKLNFSEFKKTIFYDRNELRAYINSASTYAIHSPEIKLV